MTAPPGEFALVLHTHLPWVADHGVWPVGEEWLFQAWGHSWLPVTRVLRRLAEDGHTEVLTLGVTPMVAAQVGDERLARDLGTWLGGQMWRAEEQRWHRWLADDVQALSHHHWRHHQDLLAFHEQVEAEGGLLSVWADLADRGVIELLGGPATHPYLPVLGSVAAVDAQLETGLGMHERWAGHRPTGLWPPELGYRPAGRVLDPTAPDDEPRTGPSLPGLEDAYARAGITHVPIDGATLVRAAGGPDRDWTLPTAATEPVTGPAADALREGVLIGDSDVAAFGRDLAVDHRVWSAATGYPGDPWYRDFHAQGSFGVHRSHRVTGQDVPLPDKAVYDPDAAVARTSAHVEDLHGMLREVLGPHPGGLVTAAFDTELLGHWWYEGPVWLERLLRRVAADPDLRLTTLASRRRRHPPTRRLHLPESSWGFDKGHGSWVAPATRTMWERIAATEDRARAAVSRVNTAHVAAADDLADAARAQLARELAQLRCSDWPFMVTRGRNPGYAADRTAAHADAAEHLCSMLEQGEVDAAWLERRRARVPAPADPTPLVRALLGPQQVGSLT